MPIDMKKSWFLKWILALGIVIVMNLLFNYGIRTFYKPAPAYGDFCKVEQVSPVLDSSEECLAAGGSWNGNPNFDRPIPYGSGPVPPKVVFDTNAGYCYAEFTCNNNFMDATSIYNRNVFIILVILGIISLAASFMFTQAEAVSLGLSFGGVISIVVGAIRYWSNMDDKLRFGVLLVGFITLIWLGIKKIRD